MTSDEVADGIVTNILTSLITSFLLGIEKGMPTHSKKARLIRKVEEAITAYGKSSSINLTESQVVMGVKLYNFLLDEFQKLLEEDLIHEYERTVEQLLKPGSTEKCL